MEWIAHRGKTNQALENTTEAFKAAAIDALYQGIECDIYPSIDGEFFVFHDEDFSRLSNYKTRLLDLTSFEIEAIKLYDINGQAYAVPKLTHFLDICKTHQKRPIIEIKQVHQFQELHQLLQILEPYLSLNPMIISFQIDYLKYLRALAPIELLFLTSTINDEMIYDCRVNEIGFNLHEKLLNDTTVALLKKKGFKIGFWTVSKQEKARLAEKLQVDYLTVDTTHFSTD
ncbi:MAG: glycerophosphodiester phosphodiesterase family protein [Acholeplasmataceae bacterium]|nr:hypothetical protein [Acholeplasmataceae bacterium]